MSQRRTKMSKSQPSTSTQEAVDLEDEMIPASQISPDKTLSNQERAHHVANAVKHILAAIHENVPITRSAISKAIDCHNKNFRLVMNDAQRILLDTFGYKFVDVDNGKFILVNTIVNDMPYLNFEEEVQNHHVLLFLTLTHIFMSGERCTESSLEQFLKRLDIIGNGIVKHETFGNVLDVIYNEFTKECYLDVSKSENTENNEREITWGKRAHAEISRKSILEFVSQVYGRDMKDWTQQYSAVLRENLAEAESQLDNGA